MRSSCFAIRSEYSNSVRSVIARIPSQKFSSALRGRRFMPNSHAVRMAQVRFGSLYFRSCPLSTHFLARRRRDKPSNQGIQPTIAFDAAFEGDRSVGPLSTSGAPPVSIQRKLDAPCSVSLRKAGHQAGFDLRRIKLNISPIARAGRGQVA